MNDDSKLSALADAYALKRMIERLIEGGATHLDEARTSAWELIRALERATGE